MAGTDITTGPFPFDIGLSIHGAANHQEDDLSNFQGGALDPTVAILDVNLSEQSTLVFVSSSTIDESQIYLVEGVSQEGIIITEQIQLTGLDPVTTLEKFVKLYSVTKQAGASLDGAVVVSGAVALGIMPGTSTSGTGVEVTQLRSLLARATSNPTKGKVFYEKFFITNGTLQVIDSLTVEEFTDPQECAHLAFDPSINDDTLSTNRLVRPKDIPLEDWFNLPRTILNFCPGDSIGVWIQVVVPASRLIVDKLYIIKLTVDGQVSYLTLLQPKASARTLETIIDFRYDHPIGGGNPNRFIELVGGRFVPIMFHVPDPNTFRDEFYYNSRLNRLFKKIKSKPNPVWKIVR